jgi:hypothetical protein
MLSLGLGLEFLPYGLFGGIAVVNQLYRFGHKAGSAQDVLPLFCLVREAMSEI